MSPTLRTQRSDGPRLLFFLQHPDRTYRAQPGELKPGITAWHVISFQTSFAPGSAELLITGCGAVSQHKLQNWWWWQPRVLTPHPDSLPSILRLRWAPGSGPRFGTKEQHWLWQFVGLFLWLPVCSGKAEQSWSAGEPSYQGSCIRPTPQESSRSVTWFNSKIIKCACALTCTQAIPQIPASTSHLSFSSASSHSPPQNSKSCLDFFFN